MLCGRIPLGPAAQSLRGEITCLSHDIPVRCAFCLAPGSGGSGWRILGGDRPRCPTCSADAVDTPGDVRARLGAIRDTIRDLGFALRAPVRVQLATVAELTGAVGRHPSGSPLGTTELRTTGARTAEAIRILVLAGLPELVFGRVVGHELGHAWLAQFGARPLDPAVEEGVCELIAYAWLKRASTPFADALRDQIRRNPDPCYGGGFRTVHTATRQHTLKTVITSLAASGQLPDPYSP